MVDDHGGSAWSHLDGSALSGPLAGEELEILALQTTTWGAWLKEHPDSTTVDIATGYENQYGDINLGNAGLRGGFLATLGEGEISFRAGSYREAMTCFWGFCEVLPDRVSILAELGERAEEIDLERAALAAKRAEARMNKTASEEGYGEAVESYRRALTRLTVAKKRKS